MPDRTAAAVAVASSSDTGVLEVCVSGATGIVPEKAAPAVSKPSRTAVEISLADKAPEPKKCQQLGK